MLSFGALGFVFAVTFVRFRAAWALGNLFEYPVWLIGGFLVPLGLFPDWVRPISWVLAPTWGMNAIRESALGGSPLDDLLLCVGLGAVDVGPADIPDHLIAQRHRRHTDAGIRLGVVCLQPARNRVEIGLRLRERDAPLQPADDAEKMAAVIGELRRRQAERQPDLIVRVEKTKPCRHHAHDGVRLVVEVNRLPDDRWIRPEAFHPERVAEQHNSRRGRAIFLGCENAPSRAAPAGSGTARRRLLLPRRAPVPRPPFRLHAPSRVAAISRNVEFWPRQSLKLPGAGELWLLYAAGLRSPTPSRADRRPVRERTQQRDVDDALARRRADAEGKRHEATAANAGDRRSDLAA